MNGRESPSSSFARPETVLFKSLRLRHIALVVVFVLATHQTAFAPPPACNTAITAVKWTGDGGTGDWVRGKAPAGCTITISWVSFMGDTYSPTALTGADGTWQIHVGDGGIRGPLTISGNCCTGSITINANDKGALLPGQNKAETVLAVLPGSTGTVAGANFNLAGSFAFLATNVDYDTNSATYGDLSGVLPASSFQLEGASGTNETLSLALNGDQPWTFSMLSAWAATNASDDAISFTIPLTGTVIFGLGPSNYVGSFSGDVMGSSQFLTNGDFELMNMSLNFSSIFGPITGYIFAGGTTYLTYDLNVSSTPTNAIILSWNTNATGLFLLQEADSLTSTNWANVTNGPTVVGNQNQVILSPLAGSQFFRLAAPTNLDNGSPSD
jgi:hypothetical protein